MKEEPIIEKGIPLPGPGRGHKRGTWDFMHDMEVGDSFEIPAPLKSACLAHTRTKVCGDKQFASRMMGKDVYRIWRVA